MFRVFPTLSVFLSVVASVHGHGLITGVTGANGITSQGFAVVDGTPRNTGLPIKAVEGDTSIIRNAEIKSGKVGGCGRTEFGGNTDVAASLIAASAAGLPSAGADGSVTMTLHQVNQDGAGPYACDVSPSGSATDFVAMQVTQNVPGTIAGLSLAVAKNFTLVAQMPAGTACTGGPQGDACVVRCRNKALAGPFGSCVAVTTAGAAGGAAATAGTAAAGAADTAGAAGTAGAAAASTVGAAGTAGAAAAGTADVAAVSDTTTGKASALKAFGDKHKFGAFAGVRKRWISSRVSAKGAAWI